jgi:hypothetical protein
MKKILFIVPILFCIKGYSQTLSVKDIVNIANGQNAKAYLTSKSFELTDENSNPQIYFLNKGTDKEEQVIYETKRRGVVYVLKSLDYLNFLIKQAQKQFHLILKDDQKKDAFYQFGDGIFSIEINMDKIRGRGSIGAGRR